MPSIDRRRLLATLGTAVGFGTAGCVGDRDRATKATSTGRNSPTDADTPTPTDTATATDTASTTDDATADERSSESEADPPVVDIGQPASFGDNRLIVGNVTAQHSANVIYTDSGQAITPEQGGRFLIADVRGDDGSFESGWELRAGGTRYERKTPARGFDGRGSPYSLDNDGPESGWISFVVPAELDTTDARIVATDHDRAVGAVWRLSDHVRERLRQPLPTVELRRFEVPDSVDPEEEFPVRVTAQNVGSVPGAYRAVLNVRGGNYAVYPHRVELPLEPGEKRTWTRTFGGRGYDAGDTVDFSLSGTDERLSRSVSVAVGTAVGTA